MTINNNMPSYLTQNSEAFNVTVRDVSGKVVYIEQLNVNGVLRNDYDFSDFAKGVYFMHIQSGDKAKVEKLIIH